MFDCENKFVGNMLKSEGLGGMFSCPLNQFILFGVFYMSLKTKLMLIQTDSNK